MGLEYEHSVQKHLFDVFRGCYIPGPWFRYRRESFPRMWWWAQPDGIAPDPNTGIIRLIEIKYKHTPDAYFQLYDKYIPLLDFWLNKPDKLWSFAPVEVCYWYDKAIAFPAQVVLQRSIREARVNEMNVHICRPGKGGDLRPVIRPIETFP